MKIILFLLLIHTQTLLAEKAIVLVLEAPMLKEKKINSKVLQLVRKGEKIFIHGKDLSMDAYQRSLSQGIEEQLGLDEDIDEDEIQEAYLDDEERELKEVERELIGHEDEDTPKKFLFYQTVTKTGETAYIPRRYVKPITNDFREFEKEISPFERDPTDYRIEEPLPKGYPLVSLKRRQSTFSLGVGPQQKVNYPYTRDILRERFRTSKGIDFTLGRPVEFDIHRKFFFGLSGHIYSLDSEFTFTNGSHATEAKAEFGIGPYINYEFFRSDDFSIHLGGGFIFSYRRAVVKFTEVGGVFENRIFSSWTIYPQFRTYIRFPKVIDDSIDLIAGIEVKLHLLPYSLEAGLTQDYGNWNEDNDKISYAPGARAALHFGAQMSY